MVDISKCFVAGSKEYEEFIKIIEANKSDSN